VLAQTASQNADTKGLATTTSEVLVSQEQELKSYLKISGIRIDTKKLAAKLDKNTDAALTAAQQNNNYDQAYFNYLKTNLATYQNDLATASKGAGKKAQVILSAANVSVQTLLSAPQLK
jgi:NAD(P)H-dependent flavin oxidoreductase YrpB (nitropropane dioxygenase family)